MLQHLKVKNFAIVRDLAVDWRAGMTTITGETGAGKSIAIDALGLCLGERATSNTVRPNTDKAELSATFDISHNPAAIDFLHQHDLDAEGDCVIRRVVSKEGRSRAYINGVQVPSTQLKQLGHLLIHIHGQHDHQLLLKANEQRKLLDQYAGHSTLTEAVKFHFQHWKKLNLELEQLKSTTEQREAKKQLLQYQVRELDEFSLQSDEFTQLEQDFKRQSNAQQLVQDSQLAYQLLADDEQFNVVSTLQKITDLIDGLADSDEHLKPIQQTLNDSLIQLEDVSRDLAHYSEKLELDPETFAFIEERYSMAINLAQKHHIQPEKLVEYHQQLSKELAAISNDDSRLDSLILEIEQCQHAYLQAAEQLSASRHQAASLLSELISASMRELNMPNANFKVAITHSDNEQLTSHGADEILFVASMNPGQPLEALHKVASGGELSRISLAIQVILAAKVVTPTLIFDEVDVGISGPTAAAVGKKLQQLGENTQVICVTHLPQVASKGHQQLFVSKLTDGEITETKVIELNQQSRVREIARLLAGDSITHSSLANAEELLAS